LAAVPGGSDLKFAVTFGRMHPRLWVEAAEAADRLGFESAWLPEHLVLPVAMSGSPHSGAEHPPVPPTTQLFDPAAYLSFIAARTSTLRLGTYVYLLGLRHPFVTARAFATLDWVSGGRAVIGAGAGWLREEWRALGIDPATRGSRLDEAIAVCRRLWTEATVANDGPCFPFDEVAFEPKPVQQPIPILVGGESAPALHRAGRLGDGWIGMSHTPDSAAAAVAVLRAHRAEAGRLDQPFEVTVGGECASEDEVAAWADAGVGRLIVSPWRRSAEVLDAMAAFSARFIGARAADE
jgi:probable F420-dependent oxidoreductase